MSTPVLKPDLRKKREVDEIGICIICNQQCVEDKSNLSLDAWGRLKNKSEEWKGYPKYGSVYDSVNWEAGPQGIFFHKKCRASLASQRTFTQAKRVKEAEDVNVEENNHVTSNESTASDARASRSNGVVHDKHLCVWCMKPEDTKNKIPLCIIQQLNSWNTFKNHTIYLQDSDMRSRILTLINSTPDPFAHEIRYHRSCWMQNIRPCYRENTSLHVQDVRPTEMKQMFFKRVRTSVIDMNEPRTLQGLLLDYNEIRKNFGFDSITHTSVIKKMLQSEFKETIGFHDRLRKNESTIVYNTATGGTYIEAAIYSLGISDEQLLLNVAARLKERLLEENQMNWPPHVADLENPQPPPELLYKFLSCLKDHGPRNNTEPKDDPEIVALSWCLLSLITGARTPFQTSLSVTIHGLTRSREIATLLKRFGLGISYLDILALYDAWAMNAIQDESACPDALAENFPGTAILDNDDFKDDTLTGANTSHRTNVMFVQPDNVAMAVEHNSPLTLAKSQELKDVTSEQHKVHPYKTVKRGQPEIRTELDITTQNTFDQKKRSVMHALVRTTRSGHNMRAWEQKIGSYAGFQANIHMDVTKSSPYYFLTFPKPPQKSVVHEAMCRMVSAANAKSMPFIQLVGDQPVYTLMVQLKNENRDKFELILPVLGPFHTQLSFISAINKRFQGSGLSDILVAADVIAEGSVDQALRGKHYYRAIRCLSLMYETLLRRVILQELSKGEALSDDLQEKIAVLKDPAKCSPEQLQHIARELMEDEEFSSFVTRAFASVEASDSPMARFWLSYMEMVEVLLMNIFALRTQDWDSFKASLRMMLPWLHVYDNNKYSKWLIEFWVEISSLPEWKEKYLRDGLFSQSMTGKPYSCLPLDLWIEMTMNKGSKMKAGWKRILGNETMLFTHTKNVNLVNRVRSSLHMLADIKASSNQHKENSKKRLLQDEQAVQDLSICLDEFQSNPFDQSKPILRSLQSGLVASDELVKDFESAHKDGEVLVQSFFKERVFSAEKNFDDTVHRNSRKNFNNTPILQGTSEVKVTKTDAMENKAMSQVISLSQKCDTPLNLVDVMEYRVTDECLPIFNVNGSMRKVVKSKLVNKLGFVELSHVDSYIALVDMGFIWRMCMPSCEDREKEDGAQYTWGDYAQRVFNTVKARHPKATTFYLVNDPYDVDISIKDSEHALRTGSSYIGGTRNVFMKKEDALPSSKCFSDVFRNPGNKIRLQQFLKAEFKMLSLQYTDLSFIYSVRDQCCDLKTEVELPQYTCQHTEADTILFYIYSQLRKSGMEDTVVLDAEDTDVVILAAHVAHQIKGHLGIKRRRVIYDCKELCSPDVASVIVQLHVHTGADSVSGFYGHGKQTVFETAMRSSEGRSLLRNLGQELPVTTNTLINMEKFTIKFVYKDRLSRSLAESRARKWETMKKKSTARIPPDADSHRMKVTRANYQTFLLLNYMHPEVASSPLDHGWCMKYGKCVPLRYTQPALPQCLSNLKRPVDETSVCDSDTSSSDDSDSDDSDSDS